MNKRTPQNNNRANHGQANKQNSSQNNRQNQNKQSNKNPNRQLQINKSQSEVVSSSVHLNRMNPNNKNYNPHYCH
jgi:hypothetical protein